MYHDGKSFPLNRRCMARTLNKEAHEKKRNDILNIVLELIYSKGYDDFTVQDVRHTLGISSGAFHHYFKSREELLNALIDQIQEEWEMTILPFVDSKDLTALDKLRGIFGAFERSRDSNKVAIAHILEAWYADRNNTIRERVNDAKLTLCAPLFAKIIRQGNDEGAFMVDSPDYVGSMIIQLLQGMERTHANLLLAARSGDVKQRVGDIVAAHSAYLESIERILHAQPNSLGRVDTDVVKSWVRAMNE
jgi:AcrR family transcriptional regulator